MNDHNVLMILDRLTGARNVASIREWLTKRGAQSDLVRATVNLVKVTEVQDPELRSQGYSKLHSALVYNCAPVPDYTAFMAERDMWAQRVEALRPPEPTHYDDGDDYHDDEYPDDEEYDEDEDRP